MLKSCLCKSPKHSFKLVTNLCLSKKALEKYNHEPIPLQFSIQQHGMPALMISSVNYTNVSLANHIRGILPILA